MDKVAFTVLEQMIKEGIYYVDRSIYRSTCRNSYFSMQKKLQGDWYRPTKMWRHHPSAIRSIQSSKVAIKRPRLCPPGRNHVETGQRRSSVEIKIAVAVAAARG